MLTITQDIKMDSVLKDNSLDITTNGQLEQEEGEILEDGEIADDDDDCETYNTESSELIGKDPEGSKENDKESNNKNSGGTNFISSYSNNFFSNDREDFFGKNGPKRKKRDRSKKRKRSSSIDCPSKRKLSTHASADKQQQCAQRQPQLDPTPPTSTTNVAVNQRDIIDITQYINDSSFDNVELSDENEFNFELIEFDDIMEILGCKCDLNAIKKDANSADDTENINVTANPQLMCRIVKIMKKQHGNDPLTARRFNRLKRRSNEKQSSIASTGTSKNTSFKSPCRYYLEGKCHKGSDCIYSHDFVVPKRKELCKFYLQGFCGKGEDCLFMHGEFPCKFFHTNTHCYSGKDCRFSHKPLTEESREILRNYLDSGIFPDEVKPYRPINHERPKDDDPDSNDYDYDALLSKVRPVLISVVPSNFKTSFEVWKWQQELKEAEKAYTGVKRNLFSIDDGLVIKEKPIEEDEEEIEAHIQNYYKDLLDTDDLDEMMHSKEMEELEQRIIAEKKEKELNMESNPPPELSEEEERLLKASALDQDLRFGFTLPQAFQMPPQPAPTMPSQPAPMLPPSAPIPPQPVSMAPQPPSMAPQPPPMAPQQPPMAPQPTPMAAQQPPMAPQPPPMAPQPMVSSSQPVLPPLASTQAPIPPNYGYNPSSSMFPHNLPIDANMVVDQNPNIPPLSGFGTQLPEQPLINPIMGNLPPPIVNQPATQPAPITRDPRIRDPRLNNSTRIPPINTNSTEVKNTNANGPSKPDIIMVKSNPNLIIKYKLYLIEIDPLDYSEYYELYCSGGAYKNDPRLKRFFNKNTDDKGLNKADSPKKTTTNENSKSIIKNGTKLPSFNSMVNKTTIETSISSAPGNQSTIDNYIKNSNMDQHNSIDNKNTDSNSSINSTSSTDQNKVDWYKSQVKFNDNSNNNNQYIISKDCDDRFLDRSIPSYALSAISAPTSLFSSSASSIFQKANIEQNNAIVSNTDDNDNVDELMKKTAVKVDQLNESNTDNLIEETKNMEKAKSKWSFELPEVNVNESESDCENDLIIASCSETEDNVTKDNQIMTSKKQIQEIPSPTSINNIDSNSNDNTDDDNNNSNGDVIINNQANEITSNNVSVLI